MYSFAMEKNRIGKDKAVLYIVLAFLAAAAIGGGLANLTQTPILQSSIQLIMIFIWIYCVGKIWELTK
jgi:hypothetical protein